MSALELEDERRSQAALMGELSELSSVLKENTLEMHQAVREQNKVGIFCRCFSESKTATEL